MPYSNRKYVPDCWRIEWSLPEYENWCPAIVYTHPEHQLMSDPSFANIESIIELLTHQLYNRNWDIRLYNVNTGEVIPGALLEWKQWP